MFENLFYSLYYRHFVNPCVTEQDQSEEQRPNPNSKPVYLKSELEMVFLFQISEWTNKFITYRIILTLGDLQSSLN